MEYRNDRRGEPLSLLGYGCMRFSRKGTGIDLTKAQGEIIAAIDAGVNYFDTAYIYPGSEAALGQILARTGLRDKVNIATKLPPFFVKKPEDMERIFSEELSRLQTDHVDYYLMHMLTDIEGWRKLEAMGVREWLAEKKAAGQVRNVGFSFHGNTQSFLELLEVYDWDFCQIQYNYMDEHTQAGRAGLEAAAAKGLPVIIMEPLRGGKLVELLPEKAKKLLASSHRDWSAAEWAFRWLWDQPEVTCVLSGMNSLEMVEENCRVASSIVPGSLTQADFDVLNGVKDIIRQSTRVGCTGCGYCMPCPKGVDIPGVFRCYNEMYTEKRLAGWQDFFQSVALRKSPGFPQQCVGCGKCEQHCPQNIPIRKKLKEAGHRLSPWFVRGAAKVARSWMFKKK